jgi:hypothetical protein
MMAESKRFVTEDQFREFCQILESRDRRQGGEDLHPWNLWIGIAKFYLEFGIGRSSGTTVEIEGPSSGDAKMEHRDTSGFDKDLSSFLLKDVGLAKSDFPNAAKDYRQILSKAESIWSSLAK